MDRFMNILFATPEAAPFVKTGGLGDVLGSLPPELNNKGVDARVIMPLYKCIKQEYKDKMKYIDHIYIDMAWRRQYAGAFELEENGCKYYFIDNEFYFSGDNPYSFIHLDAEKFIFFSKAALSLLPTIGFRPDVINCNDWQTGAIPVFLDTFRDNEFYRGIKTVMTVHNLRFQGRWDLRGIKDAMGISDYYFTSDKMEYYNDANLLKGGIVYADKITTVSDTYANEITTQEYGEGLNDLLFARRNDLCGIVNGISYDEWNPKTDKLIAQNYTDRTVLKNKTKNKTELQKQLGLPVDPDCMMIGIVSRLTDQKGLDLVAYKLDELMQARVQIVILGTGDEKYEGLFKHYAWKYPDKISAQIYFSNELSHKIYASCDAFLMPSKFEPCGLSQLFSMRYGTIPIVRETGGLKDTVIAYNEYSGEGTGFSFANYNADEMLNIIYYAMEIYYNRRSDWNGIIKNAMAADYSWSVSADKYINMYRELTGIYDASEQKPMIAEKSFEEIIKEESEKSEKLIADKADEPKVIKVESPFEEKSEKTKKTTAKTSKTTTAKKTVKKSTSSKTTKKSEKTKNQEAIDKADNQDEPKAVKKSKTIKKDA